MMTRNSRRGSFTLGLAAVTLFLGAMCGIMLSRSLDVYRASADLQTRLQMQAALEGATVLLRRDPAAQFPPTLIGNCIAECAPAAPSQPGLVERTVSITAVGPKDKPIMAKTVRIEFRREGGAPWNVTLAE